jgi:PAS domain S-box-containing protein
MAVPPDVRAGVPAPASEAKPAAASNLYETFVLLSGSGIARFVLDPPVDTALPVNDQMEQIARVGHIAECNELFAGLYGRTVAETLGRSVLELIPPDDPSRLEGIRQFVERRYRLVDGEEKHVLPDGQVRWVSGSALGVVEDGKLGSYWLTLADVTERKSAEEDRERRGRIMQAVAFGAARLLEPGSWSTKADEVLGRLGSAAEVRSVYLTEVRGDNEPHMYYRHWWTQPGQEIRPDDLEHLRGGVSLTAAGLGDLATELRVGRPVLRLVRTLAESERAFLEKLGSQSFAAVPVLPAGEYWGFLGFGETRHARIWSSPEVEALKAAAAVFGAAIERERRDFAIRESEDRFARLASATFEGIGVTEAGVVVDANEQLAAMLGCTVAQMVGRPVAEFIVPEDRALVRERGARMDEVRYEHGLLRADGSRVPVEVRARSLPYQGRTVRVTAIRDISARVQAEEKQTVLEAQLRQSADQWRQTFDALDLGIVLADDEERVVRLNRAALELVRAAGFGDAVGQKLEALSDREPWRAVIRLHREIGEKGTSVVGEARDPASGRAFYLLGSPWPRAEGGAPWRVLTFRDVTEVIAIQDQLRRARAMEAMGSLVAGVAHEVRNPLFSISATVDMLEVELGAQPDFPESAALLRSQVNRLSQLMRDLLDYGRPAQINRTVAHLPDVARRAVRSCATLLRERGVRVEETFAPDLPGVQIDSAQVEQALQNLLANAIQHAPPGSVVRLEAGLDPGADHWARCAVRDEGPGIPLESLGRVFEPFFSRRKGGTGLGLSIVQRVAEAHGGEVTAENAAEGGARFTLRLPLRTPSSSEESPR